MTVPATEAIAGPYTGTDALSTYAFDFQAYADTDVRVVETLISTGAETDLVLNGANGFIVSRNLDQDATPGGTITYRQGGVTTVLPSTKKLTIVPNYEFEQPTDIPNGGGFFASVVERALDRCTSLIKQLKVDVDRSVKVNVSSDTDPDELVAELLQAEANASASAAAAAVSESNAAVSESNAATSAAAAQAAAASVLWNDVVFKTFADSPISITSADSGKLFAIDVSSGNVVVNLPQISTLVLPWTLGIKKTDNSSNTVTVNRSGTDTIDGNTNKIILSPDSGATFVPDKDPSPDEWTTADFGAAVGQQLKQQFSAGTDFTAGTTTTLTLTETPLPSSKDALDVYFDTGYQQENTFSYNPTTGVVTFSSPIPIGTQKVQFSWGTPLAIGTPADGTVTTPKIADANVTLAKIQNISTARVLGRSTAGSGAPEQLSLSGNLNLSGGVLSANPVSGNTVATTSGTFVDFTGIPSWVKRITVMLKGFSTNGTNNYLLQLGSGSIDTAGYNGSSVILTNATLPSVTNTSNGFHFGNGSAANVWSGSITLVHMGSNIWLCNGSISQSGVGALDTAVGDKTLSGTLDRIRFTTNGGTDTFDAGSINIIYE